MSANLAPVPTEDEMERPDPLFEELPAGTYCCVACDVTWVSSGPTQCWCCGAVGEEIDEAEKRVERDILPRYNGCRATQNMALSVEDYCLNFEPEAEQAEAA